MTVKDFKKALKFVIEPSVYSRSNHNSIMIKVYHNYLFYLGLALEGLNKYEEAINAHD